MCSSHRTFEQVLGSELVRFHAVGRVERRGTTGVRRAGFCAELNGHPGWRHNVASSISRRERRRSSSSPSTTTTTTPAVERFDGVVAAATVPPGWCATEPRCRVRAGPVVRPAYKGRRTGSPHMLSRGVRLSPLGRPGQEPPDVGRTGRTSCVERPATTPARRPVSDAGPARVVRSVSRSSPQPSGVSVWARWASLVAGTWRMATPFDPNGVSEMPGADDVVRVTSSLGWSAKRRVGDRTDRGWNDGTTGRARPACGGGRRGAGANRPAMDGGSLAATDRPSRGGAGVRWLSFDKPAANFARSQAWPVRRTERRMRRQPPWAVRHDAPPLDAFLCVGRGRRADGDGRRLVHRR